VRFIAVLALVLLYGRTFEDANSRSGSEMPIQAGPLQMLAQDSEPKPDPDETDEPPAPGAK
jgi:hypothetical protein